MQYAFDPKGLPGARERHQRGTRDASGGCSFEEHGSGSAGAVGATVTVITEVAFDPSTCGQTLAIATYPRSRLPRAVEREVTSPTAGDADATPVATSMAVSPWYTGSLKVNVEDLPQIDVTTTRSQVQWTGSSCVTGSYHSPYWDWRTRTGWQRTNASSSKGRTCARAYTNTYGKYRNGKFCATIDTWTEHSKTWFEGRPHGGWYWSYNVQKWGGCSALLHYEYILVTP